MSPRCTLRFIAAILGLLTVESISGWIDNSTGAAFAASPALVFEAPRAEFGERYQGSIVEHEFPFENRGSASINIQAVIPRSDGATGEAIPTRVAPGARGFVKVRIPLGDRLGETNFRIAVDSDDPAAPRVRLGLSGFVQSAYQPADFQIDFGVVEQTRGRGSSFEVGSREIERLEVHGFESSVPWLSAEVQARSGEVGEQVRLLARVAEGAPLGLNRGRLVVRTNVPHQPTVSLPFVAQIYGDIVPDRNPISLGLARLGEEMHGEVRLTHREGLAFDFARAEAPAGIEVVPTSCPGEETVPSCLLLRVIARPTVPGTLEGEFKVSFRGATSVLPLRFSGVIAGPNTEIRKIDLTQLANDRDDLPWATGPTSSPTGPTSSSNASSPAAATPTASSPPTPQEETPEAVLRWKASNQEGVYGFLVLRSRDRVGPFLRVNDSIVRTNGGGSYEFHDRKVEFGATYYYYLDLVTVGGTTRRFSGVLSKNIPPQSQPPANSPNPDARDSNR